MFFYSLSYWLNFAAANNPHRDEAAFATTQNASFRFWHAAMLCGISEYMKLDPAGIFISGRRRSAVLPRFWSGTHHDPAGFEQLWAFCPFPDFRLLTAFRSRAGHSRTNHPSRTQSWHPV